jgi:hypothetical protein
MRYEEIVQLQWEHMMLVLKGELAEAKRRGQMLRPLLVQIARDRGKDPVTISYGIAPDWGYILSPRAEALFRSIRAQLEK